METRARRVRFSNNSKKAWKISPVYFIFIPSLKNHSRIVRFYKLQSEIFLERVRQRGVHFLEAE